MYGCENLRWGRGLIHLLGFVPVEKSWKTLIVSAAKTEENFH